MEGNIQHPIPTSRENSSNTLTLRSSPMRTAFPQPRQSRRELLKFKEDYRGRLSVHVSRFLGYRIPGAIPHYEPLPFPPFTWLHKLPLRYELWIFAWLGAFGGILLIESIMASDTAFRDVYHAPIIVTSFGASAVLLFGVIESPLAQPRNFVLGQFVSALVGTALSRLFVLNASYRDHLNDTAFHGTTFINGGLSMATALLAQLVIGAVHPPAGATALNAAVEPGIVALSWRYLPTVLASSLIMLGWALIVNNLGRRRYPIYWWSPESMLVREAVNGSEDDQEKALQTLDDGPLRKAEDGGRGPEGLFDERLEGEDGDETELDGTQDPSEREELVGGMIKPPSKEMNAGQRIEGNSFG